MRLKVMEAWMGSGKSAKIRCLDLDRWQACDVFLVSLLNTFFEVFQRILGLFLKIFNPRSDNVTEGSIRKFIETHQQQLEGLVLTGMGHVTDMLFITCLPKTKVTLQCWIRSWEKLKWPPNLEPSSACNGHGWENLPKDPVWTSHSCHCSKLPSSWEAGV